VFVGLCPHDEIPFFDSLFPPVGFIDPTRNMKWYATKLIAARQRLDLKYWVVRVHYATLRRRFSGSNWCVPLRAIANRASDRGAWLTVP
jgi:hypothetical protein